MGAELEIQGAGGRNVFGHERTTRREGGVQTRSEFVRGKTDVLPRTDANVDDDPPLLVRLQSLARPAEWASSKEGRPLQDSASVNPGSQKLTRCRDLRRTDHVFFPPPGSSQD